MPDLTKKCVCFVILLKKKFLCMRFVYPTNNCVTVKESFNINFFFAVDAKKNKSDWLDDSSATDYL